MEKDEYYNDFTLDKMNDGKILWMELKKNI